MNQSALDLEKEKSKLLRLQAELFESNGISLGSYMTDGEDKLIIGSSNRADLIVPHAQVSQIHAMLRIVGERDILLYDLGSDGGTFVAGKKIVERKLNPGESFEIGTHKVKVNLIDLHSDENGNERSMFWKADCSGAPDCLEIAHFEQGILRDEKTIARNGKIVFGRRKNEMLLGEGKTGGNFLHRKDSGSSHTVDCTLPNKYQAEIFDGNNELVRVVEEENSTFSFSHTEKVRLFTADGEREIFVFWRQQGTRASRRSKDHESPALQRSLLLGGTLAAIALVFLSYVPMKKEDLEEATTPKSSYYRVSMDSSPAPAAASPAPAQDQGAKSEQTKQPQQQVSKAASISSSLSKLLNKKSSLSAETIDQAISQNGNQTTRMTNIKSGSMKSQEIAAGAVGGGSVNVNAISAGLASGSGGKAGALNGFANGKGTSIGGAGSGFNGKGFDMSLGGDEAEAIGGLDKSLIAAVVQANIGQIKHCYERQLIIDPNVFGKIVAEWTINKDGLVSVSSVKKTTMNNKSVENCIISKIKGWTFPKPKGGGQVIVSYPFLFKSLN